MRRLRHKLMRHLRRGHDRLDHASRGKNEAVPIRGLFDAD